MAKQKGKTQLNAFLPTVLHKKLKMRSIEEERSMAAILEEALLDYLANKCSKSRAKKPR